MTRINTSRYALSEPSINVSFEDIKPRIRTSQNPDQIYETARASLASVLGQWTPRILYQWFEFNAESETSVGIIGRESKSIVRLELGHSQCFLNQAEFVIAAVYTIGNRLDQAYAQAVSKGQLLESYLIDLIGLCALDKVGDLLKNTAESQARKLNWGVSPFLSPGSVHGWALEEQSKVCQLLPIDKIDVSLSEAQILTPMKTIAALIGVGPGYPSQKVGPTCEVCSKKAECQMRQNA